MGSSVVKARARAFQRQKGRCCYCQCPTWLSDAAAFARQHGLTASQASELRATAEHLVARQDGGKGAANIAVACLLCNRRRHQRTAEALSADAYRARVARLAQKGRWWPFAMPEGPLSGRRTREAGANPVP